MKNKIFIVFCILLTGVIHYAVNLFSGVEVLAREISSPIAQASMVCAHKVSVDLESEMASGNGDIGEPGEALTAVNLQYMNLVRECMEYLGIAE